MYVCDANFINCYKVKFKTSEGVCKLLKTNVTN